MGGLTGFSFFPALAGKEQDLPLFSKLLQKLHSLFQPPIVETDQGIVQDDGGLGHQGLGRRQPGAEIQGIHGAVAAPEGIPEEAIFLGAGEQMQALRQGQPGIPTLRQGV